MLAIVPFVLSALQQAVPPADPADRVPRLSSWQLARERFGARVIADGILKYEGDEDLKDARLTLLYYDGARKVRESPAAQIGDLKKGKSTRFHVETEQVQNFSRFVLQLEVGDRRLEYVGNDVTRAPLPRKPGTPRLTSIATIEAVPGNSSGKVLISLNISNAGESEAQDVVATLLFPKAPPELVPRIRVLLPEPILPGTRNLYRIEVSLVPNPSDVGVTLAWLSEVGPSLPEVAESSPEFGLGRCRILRLTDGSVRVSGTVRNGLTKPVEGVKVTFTLGSRNHVLHFREPFAPYQIRRFEFYLPECPPMDDCSYTIAYKDSRWITSGQAEPELPQVSRVSSAPLETRERTKDTRP